MSTFSGHITEIPGISIDRFDHKNWYSEAYFLSHCHSDHMQGLDLPWFQNWLVEKGIYLYLSHISLEIIKEMYPKISTQLKELDLYNTNRISLKNRDVVVTILPAGHCPGSVMFYFEDEHVLYTGDYRLAITEFSKTKTLYDSFNKLKRVNKIYLDTTFFSKSYKQFPTRSESLDEICRIIRSWIGKSEKHVIKLDTSAKYGYEYLFIEILKQLKMPVHVNDEIFEFYKLFPELDKTVTKCDGITQIHLGCGETYRLICKHYRQFWVKTIRISAFRWQTDDLKNGLSSVDENWGNTHYVCYSTHASYEEGVDFVKFFKPKEIEACVMQTREEDNQEMMTEIEGLLKEINGVSTSETKQSNETEVPKLFNTGDIWGDSRNEENPGNKRFKPLSSILDSPPSKKKF